MPSGVYKRTNPGWNKGLTNETDPRVAANSVARVGKKYVMKHKEYPKKSAAVKGKPNPKGGAARKGKKCVMKYERYPKKSAAHIGKSRPDIAGENNPSKRLEVRVKKSVALKKYHVEHPGIQAREKNPNWDGGVGGLPYDEFWTEEFRESVRARDKVCQLCGKTEAQELEEFGQKLSVHHCRYGKVTKDDIFVTLCKSCNGKVNKRAEKDYWTKFFTARLVLAA